MIKALISSKTCNWATPQDYFDKINAEFNFDLDVCASEENAKCKRYFTKEQDGLAQNWTGTVWCNPPYGRQMKHWIKKAYDSSLVGATVVMLIPARVDTQYFQDLCLSTPNGIKPEIRFIRGRLKFGGHKCGAPFPSCLVIYKGIK